MKFTTHYLVFDRSLKAASRGVGLLAPLTDEQPKATQLPLSSCCQHRTSPVPLAG